MVLGTGPPLRVEWYLVRGVPLRVEWYLVRGGSLRVEWYLVRGPPLRVEWYFVRGASLMVIIQLRQTPRTTLGVVWYEGSAELEWTLRASPTHPPPRFQKQTEYVNILGGLHDEFRHPLGLRF